MSLKKVLVVYFSRSGNTKIIANEISRKLQCDYEELKISKSYTGFFGYQRALFDSILKRKIAIKQLIKSPSDYDLIIIGSPIFARSMSAPIRSFLNFYKNSLNNVAFFLTHASQNNDQFIFDQMESLISKNSLGQLSVSEADLNTGKFKSEVLNFLSQLPIERQLTNTQSESKKYKIRSDTSPTVGL